MAENIDLMIKLFDTLKQASDKNESSILSLIQQQDKLVGHIEHLPIKDLQDALKEHNKDSKDDIDSCTETVESKTDNILEGLSEIKEKVKTMITVVLVAFALFTAAGLIGAISYKYWGTQSESVKSREKLIEIIHEEQEEEHQLLRDNIIKIIREELRKEYKK